jgi:hypothetical protein
MRLATGFCVAFCRASVEEASSEEASVEDFCAGASEKKHASNSMSVALMMLPLGCFFTS